MLKNKRQFKILDLIESEQIETQQELSDRLKSIGFRVTQATISRDIKYLGLIKIPCGVYKQKYAQQAHNDFALSKLGKIAEGGIIEVKEGNDKIFVKVSPGCGRLVKQYLSDILGEDFYILCDDNSAVIFLFDNQLSSTVAAKINKSLNL